MLHSEFLKSKYLRCVREEYETSTNLGKTKMVSKKELKNVKKGRYYMERYYFKEIDEE